MSNLICIAKILKPHGIRGLVKLTSFASDPLDLFNYTCLYDQKLREYQVKLVSKAKNCFIASIDNNQSRNVAEELSGLKLYITREMLVKAGDNEVYYADLLGSSVMDQQNSKRGMVVAVHNFGAGDILEMQIINNDKTIYLPFHEEYVQTINLEDKMLIFNFERLGI